jgi:hypothetical protein
VRADVNKMLFPVKLARFTAPVLAIALAAACGYRSANDATRDAPGGGYSLAAAPARSPQLDVLAAALAGARVELSREGALRSGSAYPRVVVELVRVDEVAAGIAATDVGGSALPLARGSSVGVTARAWVEERAGGPPSRDSGDLRRIETVAQSGEVLASHLAQEDAARAAARRAGASAARRVLGLVEPGSEGL